MLPESYYAEITILFNTSSLHFMPPYNPPSLHALHLTHRHYTPLSV